MMTQQQLSSTFREYCATRDIALRNRLVAQYLPLADKVARRYVSKGVEYDDLYQIASLALINAIERFDCSRGLQFSTYAIPTMTGVVKNYFRDRCRTIRMPRRISESVRAIYLAREKLTQSLGRYPEVAELAEECGLSVPEVLEALEAANAVQTASLDARVGDEEDTELSELIGKEDEDLERVALRDMLVRVMEDLSSTEKHILTERFFRGKTQRQLAGEMGVSQMYISRIERKTLERFRSALQ